VGSLKIVALIEELGKPGATQASELAQINSLVSEAFQYQSPHQFFDDFPAWASDAEVLRLGIRQDQKLLSHAGVRFVKMQTSKGLVPVAMIGAVATATESRGKGYSTLILKELIRRCEVMPAESRPHWILLWGSEHAFYEKLGFKLHGKQFQALVADISNLETQNTPEINTGISEAIFDHLRGNPIGVKLNPQDHEWVFAHKTVEWFSIDRPFAFIAYQRGMDLGSIIHEWGGDQKSLLKLFAHIRTMNPDACLMGTKDQLHRLGFLAEQMVEENLCLAKPLGNQSWNSEFWVSGLSAC
jgi:predicted GNAT family N-acyltransferase